MTRTNGPIEDRKWKATLTARVLDEDGCVHGYDVRNDLAQHYRFADLVLLAMTGELDTDAARAFDTALMFASPTSASEAATHAAMVAQMCGSRTAGIIAVAATGLSEQSRTILDEHDALLPRLVIGSLNGMDAKFAASSPEERAQVAALRRAIGPFCDRVPALGYDLSLTTALLAVFVACGLRKRAHLELALTLARLPLACAEAFTTPVGAFVEYPMNVPSFEYQSPS